MPLEIKREEVKADTTTKDGEKRVTIKDQLAALEATQKAEIAKKKEEQSKEIGRSKDTGKRVSSSTRISGLRGLEPRMGMQFYKKKTEE